MYFHIIEQHTILKINELQLCVIEGLGVDSLIGRQIGGGTVARE